MEDFFGGLIHRWPPGREDWHWLMLPDLETMRQLLVGPYGGLTHHRENLEPVRPERLHVTVQHFAPVSQITEGGDGRRRRCGPQTLPARPAL